MLREEAAARRGGLPIDSFHDDDARRSGRRRSPTRWPQWRRPRRAARHMSECGRDAARIQTPPSAPHPATQPKRLRPGAPQPRMDGWWMRVACPDWPLLPPPPLRLLAPAGGGALSSSVVDDHETSVASRSTGKRNRRREGRASRPARGTLQKRLPGARREAWATGRITYV